MVVTKTDAKKRKKDDDTVQETSKRTKVHAQRKFAQGSHMNSPVLTPVKDKDKTKNNGTVPAAELLPVKRPKTEEFVNFLCLRGSDLLPKSLEFFNEPTIPEPLDKGKRRDSSTAGTSKSNRGEKHSDQAGSLTKSSKVETAKSKSKPKATAAVQALKKKYQEQRLNKAKSKLTKLAMKVKGKNMVRTRSSGPLDEALVPTKKPSKGDRVLTKAGTSNKPQLRKHTTTVKRFNPKTSRGGLRSGGDLPPGSDTGLKTERKTRKIPKVKAQPSIKKAKKPAIASSLSDFSSDDEQPLAKKQRVITNRSLLNRRVTTRSAVILKRSKPSNFRSLNTRPTRKTKEAATLFMEMLGKEDLRSQEEEEDDGIDTTSVDDLPEPSNTSKSEKIPKLSKGCNPKNIVDSKKEMKSSRKESQPRVPVEKTKKDETNKNTLKKAVTTLSNFKSRRLRLNTQRILENDSKIKKLKRSVKGKTLTRSSNKSLKEVSSKESDHSLEIGSKTEKLSPTEIVVENKRGTRSGGSVQSESSKKTDFKVTLKKHSSQDGTLPLSKVNKTKKPTETKQEFVDSDEEPLGKKIIQSSELSSKLSDKKVKKSNEDDTSQTSTGGSNDPEQLKTKKNTALTSKETSKEAIIPPQLVTRRRQSLLNTSSVINECGKEESKSVLLTFSECDETIEKPNSVKNKIEIVGKSKLLENEPKKSVVKSKTQCNKITKDTTVVAKKGSLDSNSQPIKSKEDKIIVKSIKGENDKINAKKCKENVKKKTIPSNKVLKRSASCQQSAVKENESLQLGSDTLNRVVAELPSQSSSTEEINSGMDEKQLSKDSVNQTNKLKMKSDEKLFEIQSVKEESNHSVLVDISKLDSSKSEIPSDFKISKDTDSASQCIEKETFGTKPKVPSSIKKGDSKDCPSSVQPLPKSNPEIDKSASSFPKKEINPNLPIDNMKSSNLSDKNQDVSSESKKQSIIKVEAKIPAPIVSELDIKCSKKCTPNKEISTTIELKKEASDGKNNRIGSILCEGSIKQSESLKKINIHEAPKISFPNPTVSKTVHSGNQVVMENTKVPEHNVTKDSNTLPSNIQPNRVFNVSKAEIKPIKKLLTAENVTLSSTSSSRNDSKQNETKHPSTSLATTSKNKSQNNSIKEKLSTVNANVRFQDSLKLQDVTTKRFSETLITPNKVSVAIQQSYEPPSLPKTKTAYKGMGSSSPEKNLTQVKSPILEETKSKITDPKSASHKRGCYETKVDIKPAQESLFDKAKLQGNSSLVQKTEKLCNTQVKNSASEDINFKFNEPQSANVKRGFSESKGELKPIQEDFFDKTRSQDNSASAIMTDKQLILHGFSDVKQVTKEQQSTCEGKKLVHFEDRGPISDESCYDPKSTIDSFELSDKISSAVDSLMSLQNIKKIDEKIEYVYPVVSSLKISKPADTELKKFASPDSECKRVETTETRRVKFLDTDLKRVTLIEPDTKRSQVQENDFRRVQFQDQKPKPVPYQVLKGCSNPKSMLKPGTLIDIAGISHSPEIMTPLRPGSDGEIIPMNRPIRGGLPDQFRMGVPGSRPYEPRMEQNAYVPRWQSPGHPGMRPDQLADRELADPKLKAPVNDVWRHAFKNVKDPKSNNNIPIENPVVKKQLSLTSLAKKHNKSKTDVIVNDKINIPNQSIPFLRQNKPVAEGSPNIPVSTLETTAITPQPKKSNVDIDLSSLREKEAEFVRQFITGELVNSFTPVTTLNPPMSNSDVGVSEIDPIRRLTISSPTQNNGNEVSSYTPLEQVTSVTIQLLAPTRQIIPSLTQVKNSSTMLFEDNTKRANSPSFGYNKQILESGLSYIESTSSANKPNLADNTQADQSSQKLNIFRDSYSKRSSSPKLHTSKSSMTDDSHKDSSLNKINLPHQTVIGVVNPPKIDPTTPSSQQFTGDSIFKQIQYNKVSHASPTRNISNQIVSGDNLFKDTSTTRRTNSPTLVGSHSQHGSPIGFMQSNSIKRNSNSPGGGRCSKNIFKEVVPATRSYSPTFSSASQSDDSLNNIFSQNPNFKRSISPLCNKPPFTAVSGSATTVEEHPNDKTANLPDLKEVTANSQNSLKTKLKENIGASVSSTSSVGMLTQTSASLEPFNDCSNAAEKQSFFNFAIKKGSIDDLKITEAHSEQYRDIKQDVQIKANVKNQTGGLQHVSSVESPNQAEAKHSLALTVEHKQESVSQPKSSPNKKSFQPHTTSSCEHKEASYNNQREGFVTEPQLSKNEPVTKTTDPVTSRLSTGIYSHSQEGELDLMLNKKVNMSDEEIKRWLKGGSSSLVEHNVNCGYLENSTCECEYRSSTLYRQQSGGSGIAKVENMQKSVGSTSMTIDKQKSQVSSKIDGKRAKIQTSPQSLKTCEVESIPSNKNEINSGVSGKPIKPSEIAKESSRDKVESKLEDSKMKLPSNSEAYVNKTNASVVKGVCQVTSKSCNLKTPTKHSQNVESLSEFPITPPNKKVFKLGTKNVNPERDTCLDISGVSSPPLRDDVSSSNFSSSNEETPDKSHHEKRSIFQRRLTLKVKEKRELLPPNTNAFSPENESSVYAFEPDLPPTSAPFRRSKGKDGRSMNTTDEDEHAQSSSNSIAVQVNFDNEAVLECSTQTDVQEGDDDDTHTFYIPLQQSGADTTKPPLIQGVAVKVDTEGPDQKVIMRAKLVTKPLSTFNRSSSSPARALIGPRSGKPEQKVRPLSVKPPVGTVQPTARPKPKPTPACEEKEAGPSKVCSPQAARLAKRIKNKTPLPSTSTTESQSAKVTPANLVEAPTFYPTEKEFEDPLEYIDSITPLAEKFGLCRVVPPSNFKPECKVSDDMRFTAYNQYIHKMMHRWGPNVKEMLAIKKYLVTQSIALTHPPWIGGMEVDLPRLYQTVQQCGGLMEVMEKKRWQRVADAMKIPKSAQDRVTKLDDIYCKFLLPYDTLSHDERTKLFEDVEKDWIEREKRVATSQDDDDEESDSDIDECIVKGRSMALNGFYRIARNTMSMWFSKTDSPAAADVELEFWKHVASRQHHVCVHSGSIDTGPAGYGFPTAKNSSTSRHPWNLKMLTNNPGSILRFLGPIMGVTVPTLHVGMLFSACCWYRDPHGLPWIEYLHTGASKIWYGIPDSSSTQFRSAVMSLVPRLCRDKSLWLASDTAMVPPPLLVERGVSLSRIVQEPGQFIIVFPKAYTSSICTGYVVSESVYFAQPSWLASAQNLFSDIRDSCEPTMFSLEKLLFSIINDSRSSTEVINQILATVVSLRDGEIAGRRQLEELGLTASEQLNSKRRKSRPAAEEEEDYECEKCRMSLFISYVSNSHDNSVYCLPHAVELLTHKRSQVKHCNLLYAFSEDELEDLVQKLQSRVESKTQKKAQAKGSKS